jgi:hypothetical protein
MKQATFLLTSVHTFIPAILGQMLFLRSCLTCLTCCTTVQPHLPHLLHHLTDLTCFTTVIQASVRSTVALRLLMTP